MTRNDDQAFVGRQLGSYRITERLGGGGMGEVYRARDDRLDRDVAIKFLSPEFAADDHASGRLLREARAAAALDHPNICVIHEVGELDGRPFIVMQLIDGETLGARLRRERPGPDEALAIAVQIAEGLAALHRREIVHRDIKPENVMVTKDGRVKVLDFGLAQSTFRGNTAATTTIVGGIAGTVAYMSPEQLRGEELDARSDIFSFGTLLVEWLTGTNPFAAPSLNEVVAAILTRERPTPASSRLPFELLRIASKCLEKDKTIRYQSSSELLRDLRSVQHRIAGAMPEASAPLPVPPGLIGLSGETTFVGRESELAAFASAWNAAKEGSRRVVLVGGEPGIGKTRLCAELARACANEQATVLLGRSDEQALVPYQPFIEALGWYVRECAEFDLLSHLASIDGGAELGPLLPDLGRRVKALPIERPMNPEGQRFRLFEAVNGLLMAMSRTRPTLLVIDDLHWADQPSLLLLRHIARSSNPARLCIVGNYRDSEVTRRHPLAEMIADLRRQPAVSRISLIGLTDLQVATLVGSVTGQAPPARLTEAVAETSGGNPFFVGEVARHLLETGAISALRDLTAQDRRPDLGVPDAVRDVIRQRLSRLSEDCNRVLTIGAVIGQEFPLALVERLESLQEDRLLEVIEEAIRAQIVVEVQDGRDRCRFVHALMRETLYEDLSGLRRARLHRKIGETIELVMAADPPFADLAYHFGAAASAGVVDKAVEYAIRAGDRAASALAHEEAARLYETAIEQLSAAEGPANVSAARLDLHARRGRAFAAVGNWQKAGEQFDIALRAGRELSPELRCELLLGKAEAAFWMSQEVDTVEQLTLEARSLAEQVPGRPDLMADAMGSFARCKIVKGNLAEAVEIDRRAIEFSHGRRSLAHAFLPLALYLHGRPAEAVHAGSEAARIARSSRDTYFTMYSLPHFGISLAAVGRYSEARQVFDEAREFGGKYGTLSPLARTIAFSAGMYLSVFDYEGAAVLQREARELARSVSLMPPFISAGIDMLLTHARTHNPGPVEILIEETSAAAAKHPWHWGLWTVRLDQARAELAYECGDYALAVEEASAALRRARAMGRSKYEGLAHSTRARALLKLGRTRESIASATEAIDAARRTEDPALLLQLLDVLLAIDGRDELLQEARRLIARISDALPDDSMRRAFRSSEVVLRIGRM